MSNHEGHHNLTPDQWEARENASSIEAIPAEQLWDDDARAELIRRALAGHDVCAYTPVGTDEYNVWVRQAHPADEARFKPMEWPWLWRRGEQ